MELISTSAKYLVEYARYCTWTLGSRVISHCPRAISITQTEVFLMPTYVIHLFVSGWWFNFEDELGNPLQLVDACVELNHCGTMAPVFLRDPHPALGMCTDEVGQRVLPFSTDLLVFYRPKTALC